MSPDIFSPAALQKAVHASLDEAVAAIRPGHTKAVLIDGTYSAADGAGLRALYIQRTKKGWDVLLEGAYNGADGLSGGVKVAKSWK